jgi:hypothetical protein
MYAGRTGDQCSCRRSWPAVSLVKDVEVRLAAGRRSCQYCFSAPGAGPESLLIGLPGYCSTLESLDGTVGARLTRRVVTGTF